MWTEARRLGLLACLAAHPAAAQDPLSAIDWLDRELRIPAPTLAGEPPVTSSAATETIQVSPIGAPVSDAVGLLPPNVTGLPTDLWAGSRTPRIASMMEEIAPGQMPSVRDLFFTLLLAELDPPGDAGTGDRLFLARVDRLWAFGALDQLQALVERAGVETPEVFARYLDTTLMTGTEDRACAVYRARPDLAEAFAARVFCLARLGDWTAAALTLGTAEALGLVSPVEDTLLRRFLDPEIAGEAVLPVSLSAQPSPLEFRLSEAVGEPLTTERMPLPFAQADLRSNLGWRAQIEAAERLARTGAVQPNLLLGLYSERSPAASGGVWARVAAVQTLDAALDAGDAGAIGAALSEAWAALDAADLGPVLADLYAPRLAGLDLPPQAAALAFRMALLTDDYETAAQTYTPTTPGDRFLVALATGRPGDVTAPDETAAAIANGFARLGNTPDWLDRMLAERRLGEAILRAIRAFGAGSAGDPAALSDAIAAFRAVGLENVARRAALELMVLGRPT